MCCVCGACVRCVCALCFAPCVARAHWNELRHTRKCLTALPLSFHNRYRAGTQSYVERWKETKRSAEVEEAMKATYLIPPKKREEMMDYHHWEKVRA